MKNSVGLTLLECVIVIAVSAILLFSVAIVYRTFIQKNRLSVLVDQLTDALEYARDVAITTQSTITFCPKNKDEQCGSHWQRGQLIEDEKNAHVFRVLPSMPKQYHLYWRSTLGESDSLRWRSDGLTRGQQGSFLICAHQLHHALSAQIILLRTGRLRVHIGKIPDCKMT
jgi:type IV fimbrial biogenesis protein FimT